MSEIEIESVGFSLLVRFATTFLLFTWQNYFGKARCLKNTLTPNWPEVVRQRILFRQQHFTSFFFSVHTCTFILSRFASIVFKTTNFFSFSFSSVCFFLRFGLHFVFFWSLIRIFLLVIFIIMFLFSSSSEFFQRFFPFFFRQ